MNSIRNIEGYQLVTGQQIVGQLVIDNDDTNFLSNACYLRFEPVRDELGEVILDGRGRPKAMGSVFIPVDLGYMQFDDGMIGISKSTIVYSFRLREDILKQYEEENYKITLEKPSIHTPNKKLILG